MFSEAFVSRRILAVVFAALGTILFQMGAVNTVYAGVPEMQVAILKITKTEAMPKNERIVSEVVNGIFPEILERRFGRDLEKYVRAKGIRGVLEDGRIMRAKTFSDLRERKFSLVLIPKLMVAPDGTLLIIVELVDLRIMQGRQEEVKGVVEQTVMGREADIDEIKKRLDALAGRIVQRVGEGRTVSRDIGRESTLTNRLLESLGAEIQRMNKDIGALGERLSVVREDLDRLRRLELKMEILMGQSESVRKIDQQNRLNALLFGLSFGLIVAVGVLSFVTLYRLRKGSEKNEREMGIFFDFMNLFPRKNPYVVGSPITDKDMFLGRSKIITKIIQGIQRNHYYILGERRSGKTSLLRRLTEEIENINDPECDFQPIPIDFQSVSEETFFKSLCLGFLISFGRLRNKFELRGLAKKIDSEFKFLAEKAECSDDFSGLFFQVNKAITAEHKKRVIFVLIIDEFDKINEFDITYKEEFRSIFMLKETVDNLRLIAAGGKLEIWDRSSPFNFMIELHISELSLEDARRLIIAPSKSVVIWDEKVVDYISYSSQRKPYEIQRICSSLVDYALQNKIFKIDEIAVKNFLVQQKQEI